MFHSLYVIQVLQVFHNVGHNVRVLLLKHHCIIDRQCITGSLMCQYFWSESEICWKSESEICWKNESEICWSHGHW